MDTSKVMQKLGLTPTEAAVYLALLELGTSAAATVVRKTEVHRTNVYTALDRLGEKGLIACCAKENVNQYTAAEPTRLLKLVEDQERQVHETAEELKKVIPELLSLKNLAEEETQQVTMFRGVEAFKTAIEDVLINADKNVYYVLGYTGIASKSLGVYFKRWDERRAAKGIIRQALAGEELRGLLGKSPLTKVRYLSGEYPSPASTTIYADKVVLHFMENGKPLAIMICSEGVSTAYRHYFKLLWSLGKP